MEKGKLKIMSDKFDRPTDEDNITALAEHHLEQSESIRIRSSILIGLEAFISTIGIFYTETYLGD